ncbi:MAG: GNAT family N-acetyltransferase [Firmicutes bacterium]|nr:GNAT family N-acetyltransferase [Bacillota bacterium]
MQDVKRRAAAVFVAVSPGAPHRIVGYYTLSAFSVQLTAIPPQDQRLLARYPDVAVTLLGRLAVDTAYRGHHVGEFLLLDALHRIATTDIATAGLVIDALPNAAPFYERYGFRQLQGARYWLPLQTALQLFPEVLSSTADHD